MSWKNILKRYKKEDFPSREEMARRFPKATFYQFPSYIEIHGVEYKLSTSGRDGSGVYRKFRRPHTPQQIADEEKFRGTSHGFPINQNIGGPTLTLEEALPLSIDDKYRAQIERDENPDNWPEEQDIDDI